MNANETAVSEAMRRWRKLATARWPAPDDPSFFANLEIAAARLAEAVDCYCANPAAIDMSTENDQEDERATD